MRKVTTYREMEEEVDVILNRLGVTEKSKQEQRLMRGVAEMEVRLRDSAHLNGGQLYWVEKYANRCADLEFYRRKQALLRKVGKLLREIRQLKRTRVRVDTGAKHHKVGRSKRTIILDD